MSSYTLSAPLDLPYIDAVEQVRTALADQGFGIITTIDLAATLKEKIGADLPPQVILGACRPQLAHQALQIDPSIAAMLPCNVVVRSTGDTRSIVEAFDPAAMMGMAEDGALDEVAKDAGERLGAALDVLRSRFGAES